MKLVWCSLLLFLAQTTWAQVEPHFTQYYAYPLWLNPAMTGAMDGDYRVTAIYRNQWSSVTNAFSTAGLSADIATDKYINIGANVLSQTAGNGGYRYTNGYVSAAFSGIRFGREEMHRIVFGMQGGFINRRFDPSKLQFGDQWMPLMGYSSEHLTSEVFQNPSSLVFDAGAGIAYFNTNSNSKYNPFLGFSANHLTQPRDPFLSGEKQRLPVRYTIHGGVHMTLSETVELTPTFLHLQQGNATEKMLGLYTQLSANETTKVLAGANYRIGDAATAYAGLSFGNTTIGVSYDATTSSLSKAVRSTNSMEISLSFLGKTNRPNTDYLRCPKM